LLFFADYEPTSHKLQVGLLRVNRLNIWTYFAFFS